MKTIKNTVTNEIIINKSKFITIIKPLLDENDVQNILNDIKMKYKGATHYCFGYITYGKEKCDDDGEPSGTAGLPILTVLKKNNLRNVICVVVRYFGGIKLGAGGLTRAYSSSVSEALNLCEFGSIVKGYEVKIQFDYDKVKDIDYILNNIKVLKKYDEKIVYTFECYDEKIIKLLDKYIISIKEITMIKDD